MIRDSWKEEGFLAVLGMTQLGFMQTLISRFLRLSFQQVLTPFISCINSAWRMRAAATAAAERIRAGARAPDVARLFTPGEPEWVKRERAAGQVMLPSAVAETMLRLAKELRVPAVALAAAEKYERT